MIKSFETVYRSCMRLWNLMTKRLANKLILAFSFIVSIFITTLVMISYFRTVDILTSDFIEKNKKILQLSCQNFENYVQQVDELSLTLRQGEVNGIIDIISGESNEYLFNLSVEDRVKNLFNSRQDIEEVRLYIPSKKKEFYISKAYANVQVNRNVNKDNEQWFKKATSGLPFRYIEPGSGKVFFTFHRALINIPNQKPLAAVSISFDSSIIKKSHWDELTQEGETLYVLDKNNNLYYCSENILPGAYGINEVFAKIPGKPGDGDFQSKMNNKDFQVVYSVSDSGEWKIAKLISIDVLNQNPRQLRNISLVLGSICIMLLILVIILVSNAVTSSLKKLSRQMEKVGEGNFKIKAEVRGSDETVLLAEKFNLMVEQIDKLVNEKYLATLNEKTARLKALEARINPHFLYNSLQAISSKALLSGNKEISRLIDALGYNFRYCIKGGDMVKISDEIAHINNYLILHKARFEDRLSIDVSVEDGTQDALIPKLSIHTLVTTKMG